MYAESPSSHVDREKIFNLQLAISKLQEEVALYRSGVDVPQLLELMREKDTEIDNMKEKNNQLEDKVFDLLRARADLISKQEHLLDDIQQARADKAIANNRIMLLEETIQRKDNEIRNLENSSQLYEDQLKEQSDHILSLEANVRDLDGNVYELQSRCAKLVREKGEITKSLEKEKLEKSKQITEYRLQIEKAISFNNDIKEKLDLEHQKGLDYAMKLKEKQRECTNAHDNLALLTNELESYKKCYAQYEQENASLRKILQRSHSSGSTVGATNDHGDLNLEQLAVMPIHASIPSSKESRSMPLRVATDVINVSRSGNVGVSHGSEANLSMDEALRKINDLQEQVRRQDKYMKSKILRDKTNLMQQQIYHEESLYQHEPILSLVSVGDENFKSRYETEKSGKTIESNTQADYIQKERVLSDIGKSRSITRRRSGANISPAANQGFKT